MEISLLAIFHEIPSTIVQGLWPDFGATLNFFKNPILIEISSNFLHNIRTCICIRKKYINGDSFPSHFW